MNFKEKFAYLFYGLYLTVREKDKKVPLSVITISLLCQIGGLPAIDLLATTLPFILIFKSGFAKYSGALILILFIGVSYFLLILNGGARSIIERYSSDQSINSDNAKRTAVSFLNITYIIATIALGCLFFFFLYKGIVTGS